MRQRIGPYAALPVHRHADHSLAAQPQHSQGFQKRRMHLFTDYDGDFGSAKQAVGFHVPTGAGEKRMPAAPGL